MQNNAIRRSKAGSSLRRSVFDKGFRDQPRAALRREYQPAILSTMQVMIIFAPSFNG